LVQIELKLGHLKEAFNQNQSLPNHLTVCNRNIQSNNNNVGQTNFWQMPIKHTELTEFAAAF
jgi:hypothetical protein